MYLENKRGPVIVIGITILVAFASFLLLDHSGMSVTDINLKQDDTDDTIYNLTYYLRLGRNFNELNCESILYDQNDNLITNNSAILKDVYPGTHTISSLINVTKNGNNSNSSKIKSIEIRVYDNYLNATEEGSNKHKQVYSKKINATV